MFIATTEGITTPTSCSLSTRPDELPSKEMELNYSNRLELDEEPESTEERKTASVNIHKILFDHRTLTLFGEIDAASAQETAEDLLALAYENDEPITLFLGSPGGHVESGDTVFDVIQFINPKVRIVGTGWVGSIATHIYLAAEKEDRLCLPNTRFLIHQPSAGYGGDAVDIEIHAREIVKTRERINKIIADRTGQPIERVAQDTDRDYWMSAEESHTYGLVGKIISSINELQS